MSGTQDSNCSMGYSQNEKALAFNTPFRGVIKEKKVMLDASRIRRIEEACKKAQEAKNSNAEIYLGVSSLLAGAFLSAIISSISYELSFLGVFFYTICPTGAVSLFVAYMMTRNNERMSLRGLAESVRQEIENTDEWILNPCVSDDSNDKNDGTLSFILR